MGMHGRSGTGSENPIIDAGAGIFARHRSGGSRGRMFRPLEKFHIQYIKYSWPEVVNPVSERCFVQSAQRNIAGLLFDASALRLVRELLRGAGVADPNGNVVHGMDVVLAPFAGLEGHSQHKQIFIFQEEMVVRLLFDRNGRRRGSLLSGKETKGEDRGRDVEPESHGRSLSRRLAAG